MLARADRPRRQRLTPEQLSRIADLHAANVSQKDIAEAVGCSRSTVQRLLDEAIVASPPDLRAVKTQLEKADEAFCAAMEAAIRAGRERDPRRV